MGASEGTVVPGLSTFCPATRTRPARMRARARSRLETRERSASRTSRRDFGWLGIRWETGIEDQNEQPVVNTPLSGRSLSSSSEARIVLSLRSFANPQRSHLYGMAWQA